MFPMLERLDPAAYKGEHHMITGNSFVFPICNGSKDALHLLATKPCTRPVLLDLEGAKNSFWKWRFEVSKNSCWIIS